MKVVFMGTPAFALPALRALLDNHEVVAVCTQPDRPAGRGKKLQASPVKEMAVAAGVEVLQPEKLFVKKSMPNAGGDEKDTTLFTPKNVRARLQALGADVFIVAAYGLLLPKAVLEMPRLGCINIHASLLPKYRGASPIHAALLNGDETTGITIMHMAEGLDTGDMILKGEIPIHPEEHFPALHDRMATLGGECILEALTLLETGNAPRTPQDNAQATHASIIKKTDGEIQWERSTSTILNQIRALDPWPCAYTIYNNNPLKIWQAQRAALSPDETKQPPGTILSADKNGIKFRTADGAILATTVQAQGKNKMPAGDFLRGLK